MELNNMELVVLLRYMNHQPVMSDHMEQIQTKIVSYLDSVVSSKDGDGAQQMADNYADTWQLPLGKLRKYFEEL